MTMATMGRRTKNFDIGLVSFRGRREWFGIHHRAIGRTSAFNDDTRAGLQPLVDDPAAVDAVADLHRLRAHFVVRPDHAQLKRSLQLADRALRHEQRVRPYVRFGTDAAVLPGTQSPIRIGERRADADRAGLRFDLAIRSEERAAPR